MHSLDIGCSFAVFFPIAWGFDYLHKASITEGKAKRCAPLLCFLHTHTCKHVWVLTTHMKRGNARWSTLFVQPPRSPLPAQPRLQPLPWRAAQAASRVNGRCRLRIVLRVTDIRRPDFCHSRYGRTPCREGCFQSGLQTRVERARSFAAVCIVTRLCI